MPYQPLLQRGSTAPTIGIAVCVLAVSGLVGCAQPPVIGWDPPGAPQTAGVSFVASPEGDTDTDQEPDPAVPAADAPAVDTAALGFVGGRLRNDDLPLAARFVYIPGVPAFNSKVHEILWNAIAATGVGYAPQAHDPGAGLAERGCVPGSTDWPAADVLSRPETGPTGGSGTAVTCEVTAVFGDVVTVGLRVVTGAPEAVSGDTVHRLVVNVTADTVEAEGGRWSADAAPELWRRTVELLRRQAGGLSSAPLAPPDEAQLKLAGQALDAARRTGSGSFIATMPQGIASPELEGLGLPPTAAPLRLEIDAETARSWGSEQHLLLLEQAGDPFVGLAAAPTSVPHDCALIPCIALTYDDGPGPYTPQLLDTLLSRQVLVTFYATGGAASANPDTVIRAASEGHEFGSHTMNHPDLTMISPEAARAQVLDAAAVIGGLTGGPVTTFRPPYGAVNDSVIAAVGLPAVLWSVDTNDWRRPGTDALLERAVGGARPGGIILFHDTHSDSVAVAGGVIDGLRDRGFEPVTVSTLFGGAVPPGRISSR